ncbi:hypothetical protein BDV93DRAFT_547216 [Ceratobasidium sp. AG-I]|nr:hypothetical protein BDV93DRAFT_547216 [Ceratobasidium sp. AG-I]
MSSARRVADIPELISSIASFLDNSGLAPMMRVSQHFFRIAGPSIWREVPNIEALLSLIPGTIPRRVAHIRRDSYQPFTQYITPPHRLNLTRFDIYAPWVQQLEIFSHMTIYKFRYSRRLTSITAVRTLLPNLRILSLSNENEMPSEDYDLLLELFVCPSLLEIRHITDYCLEHYIEPSSADLLIQKASAACPGLRRLDFYPDIDGFSHEEYLSLMSSPDVAFPWTLAGFSNLRSLSSTPLILIPVVLRSLAGLPVLESLTILDYNPDTQAEPSLAEDFKALDTWFPALRSLQIYDLHVKDITAIWSQPQLVLKLHAVKIRCYPGAFGDGQIGPVDAQEWINTFLSGLPDASPHIEQLNLEFKNLAYDSQKKYSLSNARQYLRRLPLRSTRLQFSGISRDLWDDSASVNTDSSDEELQEMDI